MRRCNDARATSASARSPEQANFSRRNAAALASAALKFQERSAEVVGDLPDSLGIAMQHGFVKFPHLTWPFPTKQPQDFDEEFAIAPYSGQQRRSVQRLLGRFGRGRIAF